MGDFALFTWKDVDRRFKMNRRGTPECISDIEVYPQFVTIHINDKDKSSEAIQFLHKVFRRNYQQHGTTISKKEETDKILLDLLNESIPIYYETDDKESGIHKRKNVEPLFESVLYSDNAYNEDLPASEGVPVIAFHSYKGGVGRTLSVLAFAMSWSERKKEKLLIVDADIEAPGITWLNAEENTLPEGISYLDFLELLHINAERTLTAESELTSRIGRILVPSDDKVIEHYFMPAYRYSEQLLDMYSNPSDLVKGLEQKYIITSSLSTLGKTLGAAAVVVDLRAGISEFSAPILFDPRVRKYIVTSTSRQSVDGTKLLLHELNKGLHWKKNIPEIPEILLSMVPDDLKTDDIRSELGKEYQNISGAEGSLDGSITEGSLIRELPFASELIHLGGLRDIFRKLQGRGLYFAIDRLIYEEYRSLESEGDIGDEYRSHVLQQIHSYAQGRMTAEGDHSLDMLLTQPVKNLVGKYEYDIPDVVILGAKGAGKTFLFHQIISKGTWEDFTAAFETDEPRIITAQRTYLIPVLIPKNDSGFWKNDRFLKEYNAQESVSKPIKRGQLSQNSTKIEAFRDHSHTKVQWMEFWKQLILDSTGIAAANLEEADRMLGMNSRRLVVLLDGLEEIFTETNKSNQDKVAIQALIQDVITDFRLSFHNIGCIAFVRNDLAKDAIPVNYQQFVSSYRPFALRWSNREALRLAVWLAEAAAGNILGIQKDQIAEATDSVIDHCLVKLWGLKLGKDNSKEAYSSRWILAALSDFNGQLQARDMIRFLKYATANNEVKGNNDRYIIPKEVRKALPLCSQEKLAEVKQEIKALTPLLDRMEQSPASSHELPFYKETFNFTKEEEELLQQEGYLKIDDNGRYYIPEILRHALKFKYTSGARPKVISLTLT